MPIFQEPIESYRVTLVNGPLATKPDKLSSGYFIVLNFGFLQSITLRFTPETTIPVGELIRKASPDVTFAFSGQVRLPFAEYAAYIDLLRNEKPLSVSLYYDFLPDPGQSSPVTLCKVFTNSKEPLGEGPVDTSL